MLTCLRGVCLDMMVCETLSAFGDLANKAAFNKACAMQATAGHRYFVSCVFIYCCFATALLGHHTYSTAHCCIDYIARSDISTISRLCDRSDHLLVGSSTLSGIASSIQSICQTQVPESFSATKEISLHSHGCRFIKPITDTIGGLFSDLRGSDASICTNMSSSAATVQPPDYLQRS